MTDWERVERLRSKGRTWTEVARDSKVGFDAPPGSDPGRALRALYFRRTARARGSTTSSEQGPSTHRPTGRPGRLGGLRTLIFVSVLVEAVVLAAYAYEADQTLAGKPTGWVGRVAPEFSLPIANGGGTFNLASERSHTNVLLFFNEGLSCSPCLGQMQELDWDAAEFEAIHVQIVSITADSLSDLSTWAANNHVSHTLVLSDTTLAVSNAYDTTGAAVSMMPGAAPGHTFILVNESGVVLWRADYGPSDMSVPDSQVLSAVQTALEG